MKFLVDMNLSPGCAITIQLPAAMRLRLVTALVMLLGLVAPTAADAATSGRHAARRPVAAAPQLIVCGMTGCFEVPRGCGYEMRRAGRGGVVAVILCDRR